MHLKTNECAAIKDVPHKDLLKEEINDLAFASRCSQAAMNPPVSLPNHQLRDKLQLVIRLLLGAAVVRVLQANLPLLTLWLFTKTLLRLDGEAATPTPFPNKAGKCFAGSPSPHSSQD